MSTPAAAVCITTHNRVDCARINIEIIKLNYPGFWPVVHACSNAEYTPGMEDALVRCEPRPLSSGALNLLQQSVREAHARFAPEFFVHLEGDTWITDPAPILKYMDLLRRTPGAVLAASAWDTDQSEDWRTSPKLRRRLKYRLSRLTRWLGWHWHLRHRDTLATQFFVARNTPEFREFLATLPVPKDGDCLLEHDIYQRFVARFGRGALLPMPERAPVHPLYRDVCPALHLYSQHWPARGLPVDGDGKREVLLAHPALRRGPAMERLLAGQDLDAYNPGARRN